VIKGNALRSLPGLFGVACSPILSVSLEGMGCEPRLGIPIFGSDFWDPHHKWNCDSNFCYQMKKYARAEGVLAGFGVDSELVSDLSRGIGVSEMAEYWEKVQRTSTRPHVDLVPGGNGTGTRLTCADT
jgi:hypothetical protein